MAEVYVDNTNLLELFRLKSAVENTYIDDATVEVTIVDADGGAVTGQTWPLTLTYIPNSSGDYRGVLSEALALEADHAYTAIIDANAGVNRYGHWEIPFYAKVRNQ